ncbi:hypothetical protein AAKU55_001036 [Oxalobacteraceae bacterium GrIS 1.11]
MQTQPLRNTKQFAFSLALIRCFNGAAFLALSTFYFGMFFLGKPVIDHIELLPLVQAAQR